MKRIVVIGLVALFLVAAFATSNVQGSTADELWNKYRVKLIELLQGRFSSYHTGLANFGSNTNIDQTVLHIVTEPTDVEWHTDPSDLAEVAGYVPSWTSDFSARYTHDNTVAEKYKQLIHSLPNKQVAAQQFVKFNTAPKGFEESPHHERLGPFIHRTHNLPPHAFHFIVEEGSGHTTIGGPWGSKTSPFSHMSSIVRELKSANGALWDDVLKHDDTPQYDDVNEDDLEFDEEDFDFDMEDEEDMDEPQAASEFLGRRRRRRGGSPPVVQTPIFIASKKFHMDMKAQGLIGIPVRPQFVDRHFIRTYRNQFQGHWFNNGGQFSLLPSILWVAMRPQVVLRLSESEFHIVQQSWSNSLGLATGGVFFRNENFRQAVLNDPTNEILSSVFSESTLNAMRENNDLQDTATFTIKSVGNDGEETVLQEGPLEDFDAIMSTMNTVPDRAEFVIKNDDEYGAEEDDILASQFDDEEVESMDDDYLDKELATSELFGRRRRRRGSPPPPPPPPPVIHEKVYEATFQSHSNLPQLIAVTSDIL